MGQASTNKATSSTSSSGTPSTPAGQTLLAQVGPSRITRRPKPERSCIVCHRRKVRCDKKLPCANCTRTGVLCCYPSGEKAPRQPNRTTLADIASRLVQLERTIVAVSTAEGTPRTGALSEPSFKDDSPGPSADDGAELEAEDEEQLPATETMANDEMLVHSEYSSRYVNEILLSRVLEEEQEIQSALATPKDARDSNSPESTLAPSFGLFGMLSNSIPPSLSVHHQDLLPSRGQALQLWQMFLQNVDPVNKAIHVPTVQVTVFTALSKPEEASPAVNALLFSIYYTATTSLFPDECRGLFGHSKARALDQFRTGLERSLAQGSFLDAPSLMELQALAMFLRAARAHAAGRSIWIMYGLLVRAAQSIGLHRDGDNFKLSPFEAEMRRRLWWHLVLHDSRASEDHGIEVFTVDPSSTDTRFPQNLNDSDLDPAMAELPPPHAGRWTEMTLPLTLFEISKTMQHMFKTLFGKFPSSLSPNNGAAPLSEARRREIIERLKTRRVEELLRPCNPVIPIQRATLLMTRLVFRKFDFVSRLRLLTAAAQPGQPGQRAAQATDENLADACEILELCLDFQTDELLRNLRWCGEAYPQYHAILYLLWHLCVKPAGAGVERAWAAVDGAFGLENARLRRQEVAGAGSKWAVLTALRDKALRIRESLAGKGKAPADATGSGDNTEASASAPAQQEDSGTAQAGHGDMANPFPDANLDGDMDWNSDYWDWNALVDDFRVKDYDFRATQ